MDRRTFIAASVTAVAWDVPAGAAPRLQTPDFETVAAVLQTPGVAARGMLAGKTFGIVAGVREAGKPDRVQLDTHFSAASLTKPVFAMAVRRLVREGKLDLHKPLQSYTDLGLKGDAASITAEHVLTHGTGLVNWRFDVKDELSSQFTPGTRWQYSGEGYVLLQRVVEALTGQPIGRFMNTTILPSLEMKDSSFTWSPRIEKDVVAGHDAHGRPLEKSAVSYAKGATSIAEQAGQSAEDMTYDQLIDAARKFKGFPLPVAVNPNAAGSLWTTPNDYFTFLRKSIDDIARHADEYTPRNRVNQEISWTLSWGIDSSLGSRALFHWGDGPGVKNFAWMQPEKNTALVILTNGDHGAALYRWLLRQVLKADPLAPEWI